MLLTRRAVLKAGGAMTLGMGGLGTYSVGVEPMLMLDVTDYGLTPPGWPADLALRINVIADIHACEPFMSAQRIQSICALSNALNPDIVLLLGDYAGGHNYVTRPVMPDEWGESLSTLRASLGVYGILGNHDWWHGPIPRIRGDGGESVRRALRAANVTLLENDAIRLQHDGRPFWVAGLGCQIAIRVSRGVFRGIDDLAGTLRKVTDDAPVILMVHEPMIFDQVPQRVALTLCGHTHGGQVELPLIGAPFAEARFGARHVYGHVEETNRHMIISAGLGNSIAPVRFGRPPEIVRIALGQSVVA
jgi:predicted MPP superfamily phosphohydrolase